jgi:hypothetical protein
MGTKFSKKGGRPYGQVPGGVEMQEAGDDGGIAGAVPLPPHAATFSNRNRPHVDEVLTLYNITRG